MQNDQQSFIPPRFCKFADGAIVDLCQIAFIDAVKGDPQNLQYTATLRNGFMIQIWHERKFGDDQRPLRQCDHDKFVRMWAIAIDNHEG